MRSEQRNTGSTSIRGDKLLIIPSKNSYEFIRTNDISHISAARSYCHIHLYEGRSILVSKSLRELESSLNSPYFFRVHHSYLVHIHAVLRLVKNEGDHLELKTGHNIPLAHRRKDAFLAFAVKSSS